MGVRAGAAIWGFTGPLSGRLGTNVLTFDVDLASNIYFHTNGNGTTFQFSLNGVAIDLDPIGGTNATLNLLTAGQGWTFAPPPPITHSMHLEPFCTVLIAPLLLEVPTPAVMTFNLR